MTKTRLTEGIMREQLLSSKQRLLDGVLDARLLRTLEEQFPAAYQSAFIIEYIPEQAEDLYKVLISGTTIAAIEVPRSSSEPVSCEVMSVREYQARRRLIKSDRRKLELAIRLAREGEDT